jgi:hypothetical protein
MLKSAYECSFLVHLPFGSIQFDLYFCTDVKLAYLKDLSSSLSVDPNIAIGNQPYCSRSSPPQGIWVELERSHLMFYDLSLIDTKRQ